jgi:hypothetical protein
MAKAQGKKAAAAGKSAAKKVVAPVKSAAGAAKKKVAPKKQAPPPKPAAKKAASPTRKPAPKPAAKKAAPAAKVKAVAKVVKKAVVKAAKPVVKAAKPPAKAAVKAAAKVAVKAVKAAAAKPAAKVAAKPAPKPAAKPALKVTPKAVPPPPARTAPVATPPPPSAARPAAPAAEEKKRGRRARPRVHSSGAPAAAWLSTEKPRPASFIPAPARAEAPSAVAAPPASSDRLIRPDDVDHPAVRTVPVRIDVEQGAGRFYVIAYPLEASVRPGEGIEWDFRYLGGADFSVEEIVVEFEKPSPFAQTVFRTRKPGGARPHRQLSNGALPAAVGRRIQYTVRAMTPFRTELASTKVWLNVTA